MISSSSKGDPFSPWYTTKATALNDSKENITTGAQSRTFIILSLAIARIGAGRLAIYHLFPGFCGVIGSLHRGNRPQDGDKFITTSWILFQGA